MGLIKRVLKETHITKTFEGAELVIVRRDMVSLPIFYCGYVIFDSHPLADEDYMGIAEWLPIHGGVTYGGHDGKGSIYGFDCAHADDENNAQLRDIDWLFYECRRMKILIESAGKYEGLFNDADDYTAKSDVINIVEEDAENHSSWADSNN